MFQVTVIFIYIFANIYFGASPVAQLVKNPPAMWETWVQSLDWEDPLEKEHPLQCSDLENSMDCIVRGVAGLDMIEGLSLSLSPPLWLVFLLSWQFFFKKKILILSLIRSSLSVISVMDHAFGLYLKSQYHAPGNLGFLLCYLLGLL